MTTHITLQEVADLLDLDTADQVADVLRAAGAKGKPIAACECPVAKFASSLTGRPVWTAGDDLGFDPNLTLPDDPFLSPAAAAFISRFDAGDPTFADLVAS